MRRKVDAVNEYGDGVQWIRGSILGQGSFGRVYKATLKNSRSKYSCFPSEMAVKSAEVSVSSTLQKEREIMNNLDGCPYVITCFGEETTVGDKGVMAYNVLLEFASGGTLADRIKKLSGLPEHEVRAHTRSILIGLNRIHELGYVHCDMKPDNILLVPSAGGITEFRAKIGDFGLAKREMKQCNKRRKLIESCYWRGTPMYLSPESVVDYVQAAPSDVWAVGCIVLEMLTGKPAWDGFKAEDILAKIGAGKELPEINDDISMEARDFLKRCFVRNSMFRFTCEMLLNHPFLQGLGDDDDVVEELEGYESYDCSSELFSDESEEDSFCSSSDDESVSGLAEENGAEAVAVRHFDESVSGLAEENGAEAVAVRHFDRSNEIIMSKRMSPQLQRHHHPVCFNIPLEI